MTSSDHEGWGTAWYATREDCVAAGARPLRPAWPWEDAAGLRRSLALDEEARSRSQLFSLGLISRAEALAEFGYKEEA